IGADCQMRKNTRVGRISPSGLYARLGRKLGIGRIHSDHDLASLVEKRLPSAAIKSLVRGGLSDAEVYRLIVPRRTLAHRLANHQPLSREESDKAIRVARITALTEDVFGEPERAWRWLRKPKHSLGGKSPIEMLGSEAGSRIVEETILQVD